MSQRLKNTEIHKTFWPNRHESCFPRGRVWDMCEKLTKEIIEYLNDPEDGAVCIRTQYQQRGDWPVTHYFDRKSGSIASTPFVLLQSIVGLGQRLL